MGVFARANASLWVDGKRIYEAMDMRMHIVEMEGYCLLIFEKWLVTSSNIFLCVDRVILVMFTVFEGSEKNVKSPCGPWKR